MSEVDILALRSDDVMAAAALVVRAVERQRRAVPALPGLCADAAFVAERLAEMARESRLLGARRGGQLAAVWGWYVVPGFRGTPQTAAYTPEFAHAAADDALPLVELLYARASACWTEAGCGTHAITVFAEDRGLEQLLFTRGFGLAVVDAIGFIAPLLAAARPATTGLICRPATIEDAPALVELGRQLCAHLHQPHIGMPLHTPSDADAQAAFLARGQNTVWLAFPAAAPQAAPLGFLRFEIPCTGAATCVRSGDTVAISGAFVRAEHRARGIARALLRAGLEHYRQRGLTRCSVDWESFNPEAQHFWPHHFTTVCHSLIRHPERHLGA